MKKRLNLTIRARLLLEFGMAALLTLAVAIVTIVSLRSLGQNLSATADHDRLLQIGASELRLAIEQESDAVRGYLLTGDTNFLDDFNSAKTQYTRKLAQLGQVGPSSDVNNLLFRVDSLHSSFVAIANEQSTLRDMGFGQAAVFLWQTQGNSVKSELSRNLEDLGVGQEKIISEHTASAQRQQNRTLVISLTLVLLTWIAVIAAWLWTSRSITRPIKRLLTATEEIGKGKLEAKVPIIGNDEFATLGRAMNRMAQEIDQARKSEQNLLRQEQRRSDQMRTINQVGQKIGSILTLEQLLPAVTSLLKNTFHYYNVNIFVKDALSDSVVLKTSQGGAGESPAGTAIPVGEGIVGWVAENGRTLLTNDVRSEARYRPAPELTGTRAELAVPIKSGEGILGVLDIQSTSQDAFDETDVFTAETLSDQLAIAIRNAQLYEKAGELATIEERQRLARDLHDAVSQTLFSASLIAEVLPKIWEKRPEEGRKRLEEIRELTRGALAEMRTLLLELRPTALVEAELGHLLRQLGESITGRSRIPVKVNIEGEAQLPPDAKVALYRIAQEALNNVAKHSGASSANLTLRSEDGTVELSVRDNGKGFDSSNVRPESLGLGFMRERAKAIGASLELKSAVGEGTRVTAVWQDSEKHSQL